MSHPERLGPSGGDPASVIAEPPSVNGNSSESLADFAARFGLTQSAARPTLGTYIRDVWQRRTFIWNFASSKSMATYTSSRLGQLWQVLTPLLNAGVYYLIFGVLLQRKGDVTAYIPFLVTGVFVMGFTQRSMTAGAKSVSNNLSLIRALHFPRAALPFTYVIVELQQLVISLGVLALIVLALGEPITWNWLLVVPATLLQLSFNIGLSLVIARTGAFVRDIQQLLPFILRTWFYFSGVFFGMWTLAAHAPNWAMRILEANPGSVYIELSRRSFMASYRTDLATKKANYLAQCNSAPGLVGKAHQQALGACHQYDALVSMGHTAWFYGIAWAVVAFTLGFWYFYRAEERYGRG
jgi:teichoic acid transport system permease protein